MHPAMLMLVVIGLCLLSVPLTGGKLVRLGELRLRRPELALAGIGLQVLIVSVLPGGALNAIAILANGGVMPADPDVADAAANHAAPAEFINSAAVGDARLGFLGDVWATPDGLRLQTVYSVGDAVIVLGLLVVVHAACHVQKAATSRASPTGSS